MINSRIISLLPLGKRILYLERTLLNPVNRNILLSSEQKRGYKRFGHKRVPEARLSQVFYIVLMIGFTGSAIDWRWCRMLYLYYTGQLKEVNTIESTSTYYEEDP